jgi:hypothetical protein
MAEKHESNIERLEQAGLNVSDRLSKKVLDRINELKSKDITELIEISHKICRGKEDDAAADRPRDALVGIQTAHL